MPLRPALLLGLALALSLAANAQQAVPADSPTTASRAPVGAATGLNRDPASGVADSPIPSIRNAPAATGAGPDGTAAEAVQGREVPTREAPAKPRQSAEQSEFQRFVFASTGKNLDLFGYGFFAGGAQTFVPLERVPVPSDYVIGPGDELYIRAWGMVDIDYRVVVDRNGQINIPRVGTVGVARLRAGELESHLRDRIGRVFKGFSLNVSLGQLRSVPVFVVGQARKPGTYTVSSLSTLVTAVFASGGPGTNGSMRKVQLRRGNTLVTEFDLYDFIVRGDKSRDAPLQAGDVIVYLPAGPRVALVGATDAPAIYELATAGETLRDVLGMAGGTKATTSATMAQLERVDPRNARSPRSVQMLDPAQADKVAMRDGDIVTLLPVAPKFANAVTLRGSVAEPLRYPHTPGMRISDLIPEREALITRDYYSRKNRLVQFVDDKAPRPDRPLGESAGSQGGERVSTERLTNDVRNIIDEPNWEYATLERLNADRITLTLIPFNLGKAVLERDPAQDLLLLPGDVVTVFSSKDIRGPQSRGTRLARVEGEVDRPGVYQLRPGETLRALLQRAGGVTPQAYLYGTEFSRESTRKKQREALQDAARRLEASVSAAGAARAANLGTATDAAAVARLQAAEEQSRRQALERLRSIQPNGRIALELEPAIAGVEGLPDIPLEDGDAVVVPSRPGFVFAVGAVSNDNALLWRAGRTASNYLEVAGISPEADEDNIFVVRADGSVVHGRNRRGVFARNSLDALALAPGDTIVVPDLLNRETAWSAFVRGAKDWTQILSNFGLAAAAIKTLR